MDKFIKLHSLFLGRELEINIDSIYVIDPIYFGRCSYILLKNGEAITVRESMKQIDWLRTHREYLRFDENREVEASGTLFINDEVFGKLTGMEVS